MKSLGRTFVPGIILGGLIGVIGAGIADAQPQNLPDLVDISLVAVGHSGALQVPPQPPLDPSWRFESGDRTEGEFAGRLFNGRVTIRRYQSGVQVAELVIPGETTPMRLTARFPFILDQWMGDGLDGSFRYGALASAFMNERTIELSATTGHELVLLDRRADEAIRVDHAGILIEQGPGARSAPTPTHAYWYPVPAVVRAGGTATWLWQRQAVLLPGNSGVGPTAVVVLASEVAKPVGRSVHLFEGPRYNLDLLVLHLNQ